MKYNFELRTALDDQELSNLIGSVAEGLEGSSQFILELKVNVNTELPEDKIEALKDAVSNKFSDLLGEDVTAELISKEY